MEFLKYIWSNIKCLFGHHDWKKFSTLNAKLCVNCKKVRHVDPPTYQELAVMAARRENHNFGRVAGADIKKGEEIWLDEDGMYYPIRETRSTGVVESNLKVMELMAEKYDQEI